MRSLILSGAVLFAATTGASAQSPDPVGEWLVEDGTARIKVVSCPQAQGQPPILWGVIWAETKPGVDSSNPDPSQKNRPLLGAPILINMKQTQANKWEGKIYDANGGSLYRLQHQPDPQRHACRPRLHGRDLLRRSGLEARDRDQHSALPQQATLVPQAKGGAMAPQTKGMSKGAAAGPAADPICSNVAGLVPRT